MLVLRLSGVLEKGKISDIDFKKIEAYVKEKGAFIFLKSTSKVHMTEPEFKMDVISSENLEAQIIERFEEKNSSKFNTLIPALMNTLKTEKLEDETSSTFEDRLFSETSKILQL